MWLDSNPDVFDFFLATRGGKFIVGALSVVIGMIFLLAGQRVRCDGGRCPKRDVVLWVLSILTVAGAARRS